jgi:hypothetical protein
MGDGGRGYEVVVVVAGGVVVVVAGAVVDVVAGAVVVVVMGSAVVVVPGMVVVTAAGGTDSCGLMVVLVTVGVGVDEPDRATASPMTRAANATAPITMAQRQRYHGPRCSGSRPGPTTARVDFFGFLRAL